MRKIITVFTALALSFSLIGSIPTQALGRLSELSDNECIAFLANAGVELPATSNAEVSWLPFVRYIIEEVESNPNAEFYFNYSTALELAYQIKGAVNAYYGNPQRLARLITEDTENILVDNDPFTAWDAAFRDYNCMVYAIDYLRYKPHGELIRALDPGQLTWESDADNDGVEYEYAWWESASEIVTWVVSDLETLGFVVSEPTLTMPDTQVSAHSNLICFRVDLDGFEYYRFNDYHFMFLGGNGSWYHKPGSTAPLRYLHTPSSNAVWVGEWFSEDKYRRDDNWTYDSEIYYIEFSTPHKWEQATANDNNGNNKTHTLTCSVCGDTKVEDCALDYACINATYHRGTCTACGYITPATECEYTYAGNGNNTHTATCGVCSGSVQSGCTLQYTPYSNTKHRATCTVCGTSSLKNCNVRYTHRNDANLGHVHTRGCTICGNVVGTVNIPCTFAYSFAGTVNGSNTHHYACTGCGYKAASYSPCLYKNGKTCFACGTSKDVTSTAATGEMNLAE